MSCLFFESLHFLFILRQFLHILDSYRLPQLNSFLHKRLHVELKWKWQPRMNLRVHKCVEVEDYPLQMDHHNVW